MVIDCCSILRVFGKSTFNGIFDEVKKGMLNSKIFSALIILMTASPGFCQSDISTLTPDTISALTANDGTYRIIGVPKGDYLLSCGKVTHDTLSQEITIASYEVGVEAAEFILTMQPTP